MVSWQYSLITNTWPFMRSYQTNSPDKTNPILAPHWTTSHFGHEMSWKKLACISHTRSSRSWSEFTIMCIGKLSPKQNDTHFIVHRSQMNWFLPGLDMTQHYRAFCYERYQLLHCKPDLSSNSHKVHVVDFCNRPSCVGAWLKHIPRSMALYFGGGYTDQQISD
jgi:hypothetical protein